MNRSKIDIRDFVRKVLPNLDQESFSKKCRDFDKLINFIVSPTKDKINNLQFEGDRPDFIDEFLAEDYNEKTDKMEEMIEDIYDFFINHIPKQQNDNSYQSQILSLYEAEKKLQDYRMILSLSDVLFDVIPYIITEPLKYMFGNIDKINKEIMKEYLHILECAYSLHNHKFLMKRNYPECVYELVYYPESYSF